MMRAMSLVLPLLLLFNCSCLSLGAGTGTGAGAAQPPAPPPEAVLGYRAGTDFRLADWEAMLGYFRALERASKRVRVEEIGKTAMGREMILVVVSGEENMGRLEEIRRDAGRLADPRSLSGEEAEELIRTTPAAVLVGCAQHATEIGSTQMSMELAYRLATEDTPAMRRIRQGALLLLVPSLNPDGHQMVCDWYAEHVGTPFEASSMPWLYHKYVGHDINRDWAMITQAETRNVSRVLYEEWFPQVLIDVHQMGRSGARMFIPPYFDPINPNMDPLIQYQLSVIGAQMHLDLSEAGRKGVLTNAMFDEWLLGYFTSVPCRHNIVAQLIEMASANLASPIFQRRRELRGTKGLEEYAPRANFPEPWDGGWWRLRDIVDYEETALLSVLGLVAGHREGFLRDFHRLAGKQIELGRTEPPFAFLVPPDQDDPATAWKMLAVLERGGVEVHEAREAFTADGIEYPAGTRVVLMAQPYRAHAKDLLERQVYPDLRAYPGGPPHRPYDVTGWTLPLLMGVRSVEVVSPFEADLVKLPRGGDLPPGRIEGSEGGAGLILVERRQNNAYLLVNRILARGGHVRTLPEGMEAGGKRLAPGTFVLEGDEGDRAAADAVRSLGLEATAVKALAEGTKESEIHPVRLGLYQPWTASMDEGWTRWVLERFEFPYRTLHDAEVRAGGLRARYDVILLPDIRPESILKGVPEGDLPKKYTGGIGETGLFALRDFAREGGTLVGLDSSCGLLIDALELPVRRMAPAEDEKKRFFCPGSILRIHVDPGRPLGYGLSPATAILFSNSPVFERVPARKEKEGDGEAEEGLSWDAVPEATFVGTYPRVNPLMSGWITNDEAIRGKGALVDVTLGEGRAILIGFRCQFRAQTHGTFKVLFNAILNAPTR